MDHHTFLTYQSNVTCKTCAKIFSSPCIFYKHKCHKAPHIQWYCFNIIKFNLNIIYIQAIIWSNKSYSVNKGFRQLLTLIWWFEFRLEPIFNTSSFASKNSTLFKSGQKLHKQNHLASFTEVKFKSLIHSVRLRFLII